MRQLLLLLAVGVVLLLQGEVVWWLLVAVLVQVEQAPRLEHVEQRVLQQLYHLSQA